MKPHFLAMVSLCLSASHVVHAEVLKIIQQEHSKPNYVSFTAYCSDGSQHGIHQWFADHKFYTDQGILIEYAFDLTEAADIVCEPKSEGEL